MNILRVQLGTLTLAVVLAGCGATSQASTRAHCHLNGTGLQVAPDRTPGCTPGEWISDPDTSTSHVCAKTYNPRPGQNVTGPLKRATLALYGLPSSFGANSEADHLYPRWLGGATTRANFWPERNYASPRGFAHNPKDRLEFRVWKRVCQAHTMSVAAARRLFEGDWRQAKP